jgi:hypothetical protein
LELRLQEYGGEKEYGRTVRKGNFFPENTINPLEMAERTN